MQFGAKWADGYRSFFIPDGTEGSLPRQGFHPASKPVRLGCLQPCTPFFDYLLVSPREMRTIVAGTGWRVAHLVSSKGSVYVAVLEKVAV
jgi:hypothetical protein